MKINSTKLKIHPDISQDVCLEDKDMIEVYKMLEILKTYEFGLYVPSYVSNKTVRLLSPGQSLVENNLEMNFEENNGKNKDSNQVGWRHFLLPEENNQSQATNLCANHCDTHCVIHCIGHKEEIATHPSQERNDQYQATNDCRAHCTSHCLNHGDMPINFKTTGVCSNHCNQHCHGGYHPSDEDNVLFNAKYLDPKKAILDIQLPIIQKILRRISVYNLGIFLLHGHNQEFEFTKLPYGVISYVQDNKTKFIYRKEIENKI